MATLYFHNVSSADWNLATNWWKDSLFTVHAGAIPAANDTVYIESNVTVGPSAAITLTDLYVAQISSFAGLYNVGTGGITVGGDLTVGKRNSTHIGVINGVNLPVAGSAVFYYESSIQNSTVTAGSFIFNGSLSGPSYTLSSTLTGNATFNGGSSLGYASTLNGDAIFNDTAYNGGSIVGQATFNDTSINDGLVSVAAIFNDQSLNQGPLSCPVTFNDYSANAGSVVNAIFKDHSSNRGSISGRADVYYPVSRPLFGSISGIVFYHGYPYFYFNAGFNNDWNYYDNWWRDSNFTVKADDFPQNGDIVYIEGNLTTGPTTAVTLDTLYIAQINSNVTMSSVGSLLLTNDLVVGSGIYTYGKVEGFSLNVGGAARFYGMGGGNGAALTVGTAYFYLGATNYGSGTISNNAVFHDNSMNSHLVSGDGTFADKSSNTASSVAGNATFIDSSSNASGGAVGASGKTATFRNASTNAGAITGNASVHYPATKPLGGTISGGTITYYNYPP